MGPDHAPKGQVRSGRAGAEPRPPEPTVGKQSASAKLDNAPPAVSLQRALDDARTWLASLEHTLARGDGEAATVAAACLRVSLEYARRAADAMPEQQRERAVASVRELETLAAPMLERAPAKVSKPDDARFVEAMSGGSLYDAGKEAMYRGLIAGMQAIKQTSLMPVRSLAGRLPPGPRETIESLIEIADGAIELQISLALALIGVEVGIAEGVASLITGIFELATVIGKYLVLLIWGFFDNGERFNEHHHEVKKAFANVIPNMQAAINAWLAKFKAAPPARQTLMIGELTGQVLVILATASGAAANASKLPKLAMGFAVQPSGAIAIVGAVAVPAEAVGALAGGASAMAMVGGPKDTKKPNAPKKLTKEQRRQTVLAKIPNVKGVYILINERLGIAYVGMSAGEGGIATRLSSVKHVKAKLLLESQGTRVRWLEVKNKFGLAGEDHVRTIKIVEQTTLEREAAKSSKLTFLNSPEAELSLDVVDSWIEEEIYAAQIGKRGVIGPID